MAGFPHEAAVALPDEDLLEFLPVARVGDGLQPVAPVEGFFSDAFQAPGQDDFAQVFAILEAMVPDLLYAFGDDDFP